MRRGDVVALAAAAILGIAVSISVGVSAEVATVVSALATVVIAGFSVGTWKLFALEKGRYESRRTRLYARLVLLEGDIRSYARVLKRAPQAPTKAYTALQNLVVPLDAAAEQLHVLMDDALGTDEKVLANLAAAEISLRQTLLLVQASVQKAAVTEEVERLNSGPTAAVRVAKKLDGVCDGLKEALEAVELPEGGAIEDSERFYSRLRDRVHSALAPDSTNAGAGPEGGGSGGGEG